MHSSSDDSGSRLTAFEGRKTPSVCYYVQTLVQTAPIRLVNAPWFRTGRTCCVGSQINQAPLDYPCRNLSAAQHWSYWTLMFTLWSMRLWTVSSLQSEYKRRPIAQEPKTRAEKPAEECRREAVQCTEEVAHDKPSRDTQSGHCAVNVVNLMY